MTKILLASSSPYRRQLLSRLGLEFDCQSPAIDETPLPNESAEALVLRLAEAKARALQRANPEGLIIGSDQAAVCGGTLVGKPGNFDSALAQLKAASGRSVDFYTGLCLYNSQTGQSQKRCEVFRVHFRTLSEAQISRYLHKEQPYDCAGSFKVEGLGISLFKRLEGDDPNSLVGLPLIALVDLLLAEGVDLLSA